MKVFRSRPPDRLITSDRAYVVDPLPQLVVGDYDLTSALAEVDDDVLLLEWDLAVDRDQLLAFVDTARAEPDLVRVAPYRLYATYDERLAHEMHGLRFREPEDVWAHRVAVSAHAWRFIDEQDQTCDIFGLGVVWLPGKLIRRFIETKPPEWRFDDTTFSGWHQTTIGAPVPIEWECRPVHLHYEFPPEWLS